MLVEGDHTDKIPPRLVKRRTVFIIPKEGCQGRPEQFWPIICLNTAYKPLTNVMSELLYEHVSTYSDLLIEPQAICRRHQDALGCLDALMIDFIIEKQASVRKCDLPVA